MLDAVLGVVEILDRAVIVNSGSPGLLRFTRLREDFERNFLGVSSNDISIKGLLNPCYRDFWVRGIIVFIVCPSKAKLTRKAEPGMRERWLAERTVRQGGTSSLLNMLAKPSN